jgi:cysteine desulfurase
MPIYLDHNATTPADPAVVDAVSRAMCEFWGNPSTLYGSGRKARAILDSARVSVAALIGAKEPNDIVFTSGGTEGDSLALTGAFLAHSGRRNHVITSMAEHKAVLRTCVRLEGSGYRATYLPVDGKGHVDPEEARRATTSTTLLVSVMLANNEVGTLNDLAAISEICHAAGALVHTDAVQAVGKVPVKVESLGVDLLTLSGHKFHGPKGVGALWIRNGTPIVSALTGGAQERGLRPGTENIPAIAGLGVAAELALKRLPKEAPGILSLRNYLWEGIVHAIPTAKVHGDLELGLTNVLNVSFRGFDAEDIVLELDKEGIEVGTGSACTTGQPLPSHVLLAMGVSPAEARSSIRFSLGRANTEQDLDTVISALIRILGR